MDRETFDKLVLEHLPTMHRMALRLIGETHTAEDIMQEALLKATRSRNAFRGESSFRTWMMRIVIHTFRDYLRKQQRTQPIPAPPAAGATPEQHAIAEDLAQRVREMIGRLPARQREVLVLSVYEQMSAAEVAEALEMTPANVRVTLHQARKSLAARLSKELAEEAR